MSDFVNPDGTPIADAEAGVAIKEGRANLLPGTRVRMFDKLGAPVTVAAEDFNAALTRGYQYESPEEYKQRKYEEEFGAVEGAKAIAENLLKGATVGGSDVVLGAIGGQDYREKRAMRDEAAGMLATGAEVVGAIAPVLASGGSSAPAQAGVRGAVQAAAKAAPSAILARGGAAVERGVAKAAEALLGTGTAAKVATKGAGLAAGGAFEGGLYGAGAGLSEAALAPDGNYDRLAEHVLGGAKDGALLGAILGGGLGAGSEVGSVAVKKAFGGRTVQQVIDDIGNKAAEWSVHPGKAATREIEATKGQFGRILQEERVIARDVEQSFANSVALKADSGTKIGSLVDEVGAVKVDAQQLLTEIGTVREKFKGGMRTGAQKQALQKIDSELEDMYTALATKDGAGKFKASGITIKELAEFRRGLDDSISFHKLNDTVTTKALKNVRGTLEDLVENNGARASSRPEWLAEYKTQKARYQTGSIAEKSLKDWMTATNSNRWNSLTDNMWGTAATVAGMATGGPVIGALTGMASMAANNFLRKKGMSIVATMAQDLRKTEAVTQSKVRRFIRSEDIRHAVTGPSLELLQGGNYREQVKSYNDLLQKVARASQQPPQLRVVDTAAPRTGIASKQLEKTILANILARAPSKPPAVDNPLAARALGYRRPTPSELAKFERYVLTANNPDEAIDALERGRLTKDHVDALRENYPNRYEHLKRTILQEITESPEPPEYAKLIKLGMLLNMPLVPTLDPVHIRISQSVYTPAEQGMAQPQTGTPQNVDINPKKYATHIERIEAGEMDSI